MSCSSAYRRGVSEWTKPEDEDGVRTVVALLRKGSRSVAFAVDSSDGAAELRM